MKKELKSKDFRIGNLAHVRWSTNDEVISEITKTDVKLLSGGFAAYCDLYPILLTEDILLNFGFLRNTYPNLHFAKYLDNGDKVLISENKSYGSEKHLSFFFGCGGMNYSSIDLQIEYVHQLQNLYFALTGEELELKNETKP